MALKILGVILVQLFKFIFSASKESAESVKDDLIKVFDALKTIGSKRVREFLAAIPIFLEFFVHLVKEREKMEKSRQLLIIGAATALATLLGILMISILGSWIVQIALIISFPIIGVPLFLSTGFAITTIVVLFVWLVIYVLNQALCDDLAYQEIRDQYLSAESKKLIADIESAIKVEPELDSMQSDHLYKVIEQQFTSQGKNADSSTVSSKLDEIQSKISKGGPRMDRLRKFADQVTIQADANP